MASTSTAPTSATYTTQNPTVSASPISGTYTTAQSVTPTASAPSNIYYTKDGKTPTISSPVYSSPVSISTTTTLKFFAKDTAGNSGTVVAATYTIFIADTVPPVITLKGASPVSVQLGSIYVDAGATAIDNIDGDITSSIITSNPVNTSVLETYTITYDVSDKAGNAATQVTRTVNVVDTTPIPAPTPPPDTTPPTVSASPVSGTYTSAQSITLTASETSTIH